MDKHCSSAIDLFHVCVLFNKDSIDSKMEGFDNVEATFIIDFFEIEESLNQLFKKNWNLQTKGEFELIF